MDAGLYAIERGYVIRTPLMARKVDGSLKGYGLFENVGSRHGLRQETIPHHAAVTELIFDHGWPREQVMIESPRIGGLSAEALDIVVFEDPSRTAPPTHLAGEAKLTRGAIQGLVERVRRCGGTGVVSGHPRSEHKKCEGLLAFRPRSFLAVAAGYRETFAVRLAGDRFQLDAGGLVLWPPLL